MCSETFGYVSDNLVTSQMLLFCDSRMIFKKIREKKISVSKMNFFRILGMSNFEAFSLNVGISVFKGGVLGNFFTVTLKAFITIQMTV